jgi:SepF-like predicted cell division protein (DUF552 family)
MKTNFLLTLLFVLTFSTPLKLSSETINEYRLPISYAEIEMITVTPNRQYQPSQYIIDIHIIGSMSDKPLISRTVETEGEILDIDFLDVDDDEQIEFIVKTQTPRSNENYNLDIFELDPDKHSKKQNKPINLLSTNTYEKHRSIS